jgi:hypothetical protein
LFRVENANIFAEFFGANILKIITLDPGKERLDRSACPISGEYSGVLPDGPQLCAKISSDCNNPDIMFYSVAACNNASEVLEGLQFVYLFVRFFASRVTRRVCVTIAQNVAQPIFGPNYLHNTLLLPLKKVAEIFALLLQFSKK